MEAGILKKPVAIFAVFILILAGYLVYRNIISGPVSAGPLGPALDFPGEWEGLKRTALISGDSALLEFKRLHGKSIPVVGGYKVDYTGPSEKVILWVAVAQDPREAEKLVKEMTDKMIEAAGTPREHFSSPVKAPLGNLTLYFTRGSGMNNYYYARQNLVYWVGLNSQREGNLMMKIAEGGL